MLIVVVATEEPPEPCHPTKRNQLKDLFRYNTDLTERYSQGNDTYGEAEYTDRCGIAKTGTEVTSDWSLG